MSVYEYKVVPAPIRGEKSRGIRGADGRFAFAVEKVMNRMAAEGWEYQRSETLPAEERTGLTTHQTTWRNMLVFRRARRDVAEAFEPRLLSAPQTAAMPEQRVAANAAQPIRRATVTTLTPNAPPASDFAAKPASTRVTEHDFTVFEPEYVDDPHMPSLLDGPEQEDTISSLPDILRARAARLRNSPPDAAE